MGRLESPDAACPACLSVCRLRAYLGGSSMQLFGLIRRGGFSFSMTRKVCLLCCPEAAAAASTTLYDKAETSKTRGLLDTDDIFCISGCRPDNDYTPLKGIE